MTEGDCATRRVSIGEGCFRVELTVVETFGRGRVLCSWEVTRLTSGEWLSLFRERKPIVLVSLVIFPKYAFLVTRTFMPPRKSPTFSQRASMSLFRSPPESIWTERMKRILLNFLIMRKVAPRPGFASIALCDYSRAFAFLHSCAMGSSMCDLSSLAAVADAVSSKWSNTSGSLMGISSA